MVLPAMPVFATDMPSGSEERLAERRASPITAENRADAETCLAQAIAYEAGREPEPGQEAVAQIVLNRLRSPIYPKTVCGVVFQGSRRHAGCQFTFTCDGSMARRLPPGSWPNALRIARQALDGRLLSAVGDATHYHAYYVSPAWSARLTRIGQIGAHIFYGEAGRGATVIAAATNAPTARPVRGVEPRRSTIFSAWGLQTALLVPDHDSVRVEQVGAPEAALDRATPPPARDRVDPPTR